ncbi:MAG: MBL fold metallo-hydrolase [Gemmatimonadaceae bacterium]|nr:MBL fold metallo-hydrolase [Gemmatimonadaceae bacterium]
MVDIIPHHGLTQWRFSSLTSRLAGYSASAFLTADGILVDTGIPVAQAEFERLLDGSRIAGVMVTHHHEDHAGNVEQVARRGIPMCLAPETQRLVRTVEPIRAYRRVTWTSMTPLSSALVPFDPAPLELIAAPGHSADHHVAWDPHTRTLFSGDLFLGVQVRIAHHDEDPWTLIESLEAVAALEPTRMFCAHRGLVLEPAAALRAKAAWTRALIATISAHITRGATDAQILRTVMGGESLTGWASGGEYSRRNFIRAVRFRIATS